MSTLPHKSLPINSSGEGCAPRGLVIIFDGLQLDPRDVSSSGSANLSTLNDFVRNGCCGFLLPHSSGLLVQQLLHCDGKTYSFPGGLESARIAMLSNCEERIMGAKDSGVCVVHHLEDGNLETPDGLALLASDVCSLLGTF